MLWSWLPSAPILSVKPNWKRSLRSTHGFRLTSPVTFWEAVQSVWTIESLIPVEENQTGMSIGRVDQYMYPFYKADIESGRMTDYEAFELAGCMLIKMSEMMWLTSLKASSKFFAGYQPFVNMCVGGVNRQGQACRTMI